MSAIHYKLKSAKDYDTYKFEGAGIPVWELKNEIIERKKLGKSDDFDLVILNAQTNEEYADDSNIIPRNTSVIIKRVPVAKGMKPKRQNNDRTSYVHSTPAIQNAISSVSGASKEEDDKISKMMNESASHWVHTQTSAQSQAPVRRVARSKGPNPIPPPTYTCFRCGQPGHYINYCPTNEDPTYDRPRIKRTTGIPRAFLKTVDPSKLDNPSAAIMVTSEGAAVVAAPNEVEWERVTAERDRSIKNIPEHLLCSVCKELLDSPMRLSCCKSVCCDECITRLLTENAASSCPVCQRPVSIKSVSPAHDIETELKQFIQAIKGEDFEERNTNDHLSNEEKINSVHKTSPQEQQSMTPMQQYPRRYEHPNPAPPYPHHPYPPQYAHHPPHPGYYNHSNMVPPPSHQYPQQYHHRPDEYDRESKRSRRYSRNDDDYKQRTHRSRSPHHHYRHEDNKDFRSSGRRR